MKHKQPISVYYRSAIQQIFLSTAMTSSAQRIISSISSSGETHTSQSVFVSSGVLPRSYFFPSYAHLLVDDLILMTVPINGSVSRQSVREGSFFSRGDFGEFDLSRDNSVVCCCGSCWLFVLFPGWCEHVLKNKSFFLTFVAENVTNPVDHALSREE